MMMRRRRRAAYVGQPAGGGARLQGGDWGSAGLLGICRVKKDYSVEGYLHEKQRCGARAQCGHGSRSSSRGGDNDVRGPLRSQTLTSAAPTGAEKLEGKGGACDLTDVWSLESTFRGDRIVYMADRLKEKPTSSFSFCSFASHGFMLWWWGWRFKIHHQCSVGLRYEDSELAQSGNHQIFNVLSNAECRNNKYCDFVSYLTSPLIFLRLWANKHSH